MKKIFCRSAQSNATRHSSNIDAVKLSSFLFFSSLRLCAFAVIVLFPFFSFSQNKSDSYRIDSLQKVLLIAKNDSNKVKTLNKLSEYLAKVHLYDKALQKEKEAVLLAEKINFKKGAASAHGNMALILEDMGNYAEALKNDIEALKIYEEIGNKKGISYCHHNIGSIYYYQGNFTEALKNMRAGLKIKIEIGDSTGIADGYNNIGVVLEQLEKYEEALENYSYALKICEKINDQQGIAYAFQNIANTYAKKSDFVHAMENHLKALKIEKEIDDKRGMVNSYINIGGLEILMKKYSEAEKYLKDGLAISLKFGFKEKIKSSYRDLAELYEKMNDYKKASEYLKLFAQMKDSINSAETATQIANLQNQYNLEKEEKIRQLEEEKKDALAKQEKELTALKEFWAEIICGIIFLSITAIAFVLYKRYKAKKKSSEELEEKNKIISEKNKDITDSINYAQRIQKALLASDNLLKKNLKEYFIFFRPKDIVSGDFYWAAEKDGRFYLAVCDSTGHGVPGAFMSLLNISFLNEAITERRIVNPNEIFNHVRQRLIENISSDGAKDGMDGILICFDKSKNEIAYSAANNAPMLLNGTLQELACDNMPVGAGEKNNSFSSNIISFQSNNILFLYTDGFADQFGGPKGKKFKYKQLNDKLFSISEKPLEEQKKFLEKTFDEWKGNLEQVDDICIIGVRV